MDNLRGLTRVALRSTTARFRDIGRRLRRRSEGEALLLARFAREQGRPLDQTNPQTFTEKLYCRMIRWNRRMDPRYTGLADKFAVRPYVARKVGEQCLSTLYWHGSDPRQIPLERLSAPYVIKSNHGSGQFMAIRSDPEPDDVIRKTSEWLQRNYYWTCREYQYFDIPPRLMVEEYLANADGSAAHTYKFWCFAGVPRAVYVTDTTDSINPAFDMSWNRLEFSHKPALQPPHPKPKNLEQMVAVASRLSEDFDFVRVDLFNVDGRIVFNELTFTPLAGGLTFRPAEWDMTFGRLWTMRD
jgi:hypothetical protein